MSAELTAKQKYFKVYREQHKDRARKTNHDWWIRVGKQKRIDKRLKGGLAICPIE